MTEPQVWTLIAVFATALFATITLTTQMMWRAITARFDSVTAQFDSVNARLDALGAEMRAGFVALRTETEARFDAHRAETEARFDALQTQIAHLDRDVQAITRRVFPE